MCFPSQVSGCLACQHCVTGGARSIWQAPNLCHVQFRRTFGRVPDAGMYMKRRAVCTHPQLLIRSLKHIKINQPPVESRLCIPSTAIRGTPTVLLSFLSHFTKVRYPNLLHDASRHFLISLDITSSGFSDAFCMRYILCARSTNTASTAPPVSWHRLCGAIV